MLPGWCRYKKYPVLDVAYQRTAAHTMTSSEIGRKGSTKNAPSSCKVVLAGSIAKQLLEEVRENLVKLDKPPRLHGFLANRDPAAKMYAEWTAKTCRDKYRLPICLQNKPTVANVRPVALTLPSVRSMARLWKTTFEMQTRTTT